MKLLLPVLMLTGFAASAEAHDLAGQHLHPHPEISVWDAGMTIAVVAALLWLAPRLIQVRRRKGDDHDSR